jgi:DNA (cytosine-5)-methyltransferase 1
MTAYYNENDKNAAAWLRALIAGGLVSPGDVDERSISDVRAGDLAGYEQCHFFAGIGGWSYSLRLAGWPDSEPVWTGSCPCQPFSLAGKQKGFDDARHLWPVWRELIRECRPAIVFGEQVASATQWLGFVRSDLEAMDYAMGAMPIQAASAGADHLRDRLWFVADDGVRRRAGADRRQSEQPRRTEVERASGAGIFLGHSDDAGLAVGSIAEIERGNLRKEGPAITAPGFGSITVADAAGERRHGSENTTGTPGRHVLEGGGEYDWVIGADGKARRVKPGVRLLVDGFPSRVGLLRGFGNAIDPRPATNFIEAARHALSVQGRPEGN